MRPQKIISKLFSPVWSLLYAFSYIYILSYQIYVFQFNCTDTGKIRIIFCGLIFLKNKNLAVYQRCVLFLYPLSTVLFFLPPVVHEPSEDESVEFSWKRHRLFNHTACLVLYHMCMEVSNILKLIYVCRYSLFIYKVRTMNLVYTMTVLHVL